MKILVYILPIIYMAIIMNSLGCSTSYKVDTKGEYWPSECSQDEWTDYCLEKWEANKYGK